MTTQTTVHNIRLAIDRLADEIADRVVIENHKNVEMDDTRPDAKQMLFLIDTKTREMVHRHAVAAITDWLLGDLKGV